MPAKIAMLKNSKNCYFNQKEIHAHGNNYQITASNAPAVLIAATENKEQYITSICTDYGNTSNTSNQ